MHHRGDTGRVDFVKNLDIANDGSQVVAERIQLGVGQLEPGEISHLPNVVARKFHVPISPEDLSGKTSKCQKRSTFNGERFLDDSLDDQPRTQALNADANSLRSFAGLHAERLEVRTEPALRDTGGFATVTTQVLGLTAFNLLVTANWLLVTNRAFGTHDNLKSRSKNIVKITRQNGSAGNAKV